MPEQRAQRMAGIVNRRGDRERLVAFSELLYRCEIVYILNEVTNCDLVYV